MAHFTESESRALKYYKAQISRIKAARRDRQEAEDKLAAEKAAEAAKRRLSPTKWARDNKIRAALLEMTDTVKKYGMKLDAPAPGAGARWVTRQPFTKIHITDVSGRTEVVQIYIKHDGFEWD